MCSYKKCLNTLNNKNLNFCSIYYEYYPLSYIIHIIHNLYMSSKFISFYSIYLYLLMLFKNNQSKISNSILKLLDRQINYKNHNIKLSETILTSDFKYLQHLYSFMSWLTFMSITSAFAIPFILLSSCVILPVFSLPVV